MGGVLRRERIPNEGRGAQVRVRVEEGGPEGPKKGGARKIRCVGLPAAEREVVQHQPSRLRRSPLRQMAHALLFGPSFDGPSFKFFSWTQNGVVHAIALWHS